ncbi:MAG: hypothetical protein CMH54_01975 [Myxococcales bacterium]|nr:hypothetical protein [Myxococcales bacterium]
MLSTWFTPMFAAISLSGAIALLPIQVASSKIPVPQEEFSFEVIEVPPAEPEVEKLEVEEPPPEKIVKPKPVVRKPRPKRKKKKIVKPEPLAQFVPKQDEEPVEEVYDTEPLVDPTPVPDLTPPPRPEVDLRAYGKSIHGAVVQHQNYPRVARRLELEGKTLVEISVNLEGELVHVVINRSSGHELLDKEALRMVEAAAPFDHLPVGYSESEVTVVIPIKFRLRD